MAATMTKRRRKPKAAPAKTLTLKERIELNLPLNIAQASEVSNLSVATIYSYLASGKIRRSGRTSKVLILPSELRAFDERRRTR